MVFDIQLVKCLVGKLMRCGKFLLKDVDHNFILTQFANQPDKGHYGGKKHFSAIFIQVVNASSSNLSMLLYVLKGNGFEMVPQHKNRN